MQSDSLSETPKICCLIISTKIEKTVKEELKVSSAYSKRVVSIWQSREPKFTELLGRECVNIESLKGRGS